MSRSLTLGACLSAALGCVPNKSPKPQTSGVAAAAANRAEQTMIAWHTPDAGARDRLLPDPCQYVVEPSNSMDATLVDGQLLTRWPLRSNIVWGPYAEPAEQWLNPAPIGETTIVVDLRSDSITNVEIYRAGLEPHDPVKCPTLITFEAELTVRTGDAVIDARGHGQFRVKQGRMTGEIELDMVPARPSERDSQRRLGISLDIASESSIAPTLAIEGHLVEHRTRPGRHGSVSGGTTVLASTGSR